MRIELGINLSRRCLTCQIGRGQARALSQLGCKAGNARSLLSTWPPVSSCPQLPLYANTTFQFSNVSYDICAYFILNRFPDHLGYLFHRSLQKELRKKLCRSGNGVFKENRYFLMFHWGFHKKIYIFVILSAVAT